MRPSEKLPSALSKGPKPTLDAKFDHFTSRYFLQVFDVPCNLNLWRFKLKPGTSLQPVAVCGGRGDKSRRKEQLTSKF